MITLVAIDKVTGIVKYTSTPSVAPDDLSVYETSDVFFKLHNESVDFFSNCYFKDEMFKKLPERNSEFCVWDLQNEKWQHSNALYEEFLVKNGDHIRKLRNRLLAQSDFVELPSSLARLGESKVAEWLSYRQALRDITLQPDYPKSVLWPQAPV